MDGANYRCKNCNKFFLDLSFFYQHLKNVKHILYSCPHADCNKTCSSINLLQFHISKHKDRTVVQHELHIKCPIKSCRLDIDSRAAYLKHMPDHLKEGETFHCALCSGFVGSVASFRSHVSNVHPIRGTKTASSVIDGDDDNDSSEGDHGSVHSVASGHSERRLTVDHVLSEGVGRQPESESVIEKENHVTPKKNVIIQDTLPECEIKDQLAKFYLRLEAEHYLPTSTVQKIAEEITLITEFSHSHLKKSLKPQLEDAGLEDNLITEIIENTFKSDPVFNTHHKGEDVEQLCTDHLRKKFWKKNFSWIEPQPVYLGKDENGKRKVGQYVPIKKTISTMLEDPAVKRKVLESFNPRKDSSILSDITDGYVYQKHREQHNNGKCIYLNLFQDGCDNNAFGPSIGKYKPNNFYFSIGNLSSECRTTLSTIHLVYSLLEKHLKNSEGEELRDVDKLKNVLKPLLDELIDLKENGIEIDGEIIPVCLLFLQGDNLGQHFIGGFVQSFSCQYCCRFCDISLDEFRANPTMLKPLRTPENYDQSVETAKTEWLAFREKVLKTAEAKRNQRLLNRTRAPGSKSTTKKILAKSTLQKLKAINHRGIKYRPSPFNSIKLKFHVSSGPSLAVCIVHDFWEGIAKNMLPKILSTFVDKGWFDLDTLNRRIESFHYEGSDKADAPTRLKSLDSLGGNASENWNLVRLLPILIGDLIEDQEDEMWQLYLQFKVIAEYVFAPSITFQQVLYLKRLICEYLDEVKRLLPKCLYPKAHLLNHYPELILAHGPLIRLFTLRFESFHVFFKNVAKACRNRINLTYTLARKYQCKFALDHSSGIIREEVVFNSDHSSAVFESDFSEEEKQAVPEEVFSDNFIVLSRVTVKGVEYRDHYYMILGLLNVNDEYMKVGLIQKIFLDVRSRKVSFLLNAKPAENTHQGYYKVHLPASSYIFSSLDSLPDYYPLPSYTVNNMPCLTLKHSNVKM